MKLPKEIFARWVGDPNEEWLDTEPEIEALAEIGEEREVGVYQLVKVVTVRANVTAE